MHTRFGLVVALTWVVVGCASSAKSGGGVKHPLVRQVAPDSAVKMSTNGAPWRPADASGKVVIIDFWATWCIPCHESFPKLDAIYKRHASAGLAVVAISEDEDSSKVGAFVAETQVTFPIALDPSGNTASSFDVQSMPTEFIVDRHGVIRYVHAGYHEEEVEQIESEVTSLLKESP